MNTYNLPRGDAIRRALVVVFRAQRRQVLAAIGAAKSARKDDREPPGGLPPEMPALELGQLAVSERMTPILSALWERGGRALYGRLRIDPDRWQVTNPHLADRVRAASLAFCGETNATTTRQLGEALRRTRAELAAGVVERGDSVPALAKRVNKVFDLAERWRARRIAQSEASRAVHAAQEQAAVESNLVAGWEWLLSADACPLCQTVGRRAKFVRLGQPFAVVGDHPVYSEVRFPPLHPHCNCTCVEVLKPEVSGEPAPKWAATLEQPEPEAQDYPDGELPEAKPRPTPGPEGVTPRGVALAVGKWVAVSAATTAATTVAGAAANALLSPLVPKLVDAVLPGVMVEGPRSPVSWPRLSPVLPGQPIGVRVAAYLASDQGKGRLAALKDIPRTYGALRRDLAVAEELAATRKAQIPHGSRPTDLAVRLADQALADADAAADALARHMDDVRRRVADAIGVKANDAAPLDARVPAGKSFEPLRAAARNAQEFLSEVLASDQAHPKGLTVRYGVAPKGTLRAWYWQAKRKLMMVPTDGAKDVVHEMGHLLEDQWKEVGRKAAEFLEHRTAGEAPRKLAELFPGRGYGPDELGRKDRFDQAFPVEEAWYCGKDYRTRAHSDLYPTEILSKGLEMLLRDPSAFAENDPEYCGFVLGVLDGGLRDAPPPPKPKKPHWEERLWEAINTPLPEPKR